MAPQTPPRLPLSREELQSEGFNRVERDDRLLDVFPKETREFGVELWEQWYPHTVEVVRLRFQTKQPPYHFVIPRRELEQALLHDTVKRWLTT